MLEQINKAYEKLLSIPGAEIEVAGNTLLRWVFALVLAVVVYVLIGLVRSILKNKISKIVAKTKWGFDDALVDFVTNVKSIVVLVVSIYVASGLLQLPPKVASIFHGIFLFAVLVQAGVWLSGIVGVLVPKLFKSSDEDSSTHSAMGLLNFLGKFIVWSLVLLLVLDNFGVDITALVAGLGVGGIAVALAVQNVLGDLLSSLSIIMDKPFTVGDFVVVGDMVGTVEKIGIKTTRIKSLSGEQIVFSNSDLLSSRIRNFKRLYERRIVFSIGVIYQTSHDQLKAIPGIIKDIIEQQEDVRFDRSHLKGFGASSLDFETVYFVLVPDYARYMEVQQEINLALFKRFEEEGIEFAYPTQTLFLERAEA